MEIKSIRLVYLHGAYVYNPIPMVLFTKDRIKYIIDYSSEMPLDQKHYKIVMEYNPTNPLHNEEDIYDNEPTGYLKDFKRLIDAISTIRTTPYTICDAFAPSIEIIYDNGRKKLLEGIDTLDMVKDHPDSSAKTLYEIADKYCPEDFRKYIYDE